MIEVVDLLDALATVIEKNQLPARLSAEIIRAVAKGVKDRPKRTHLAAPYVELARSVSSDQSVQMTFMALCWALDNLERKIKLSIKPTAEALTIAERYDLTPIQRNRFYLLTNLFLSIKEPGAYSRLVGLVAWFDDVEVYEALEDYVRMQAL